MQPHKCYVGFNTLITLYLYRTKKLISPMAFHFVIFIILLFSFLLLQHNTSSCIEMLLCKIKEFIFYLPNFCFLHLQKKRIKVLCKKLQLFKDLLQRGKSDIATLCVNKTWNYMSKIGLERLTYAGSFWVQDGNNVATFMANITLGCIRNWQFSYA